MRFEIDIKRWRLDDNEKDARASVLFSHSKKNQLANEQQLEAADVHAG